MTTRSIFQPQPFSDSVKRGTQWTNIWSIEFSAGVRLMVHCEEVDHIVVL